MGLAGCGCDCEKFRINICMKTVYLIPKARHQITKKTVAHMELSGQRFALHERALCQAMADRLAEKMTLRSNEVWTGFVEPVETANRT